MQKKNKYLCKGTLKHWKPFLYEDGVATLGLQHIDTNNTHDPQLLPTLEIELFDAGLRRVVTANKHALPELGRTCIADKLVTSLGKVGLNLNAAKTKVMTTPAQPPKTLTITVLDQSSSDKRLGRMLSTANAGRRKDDMDHRLQSAARSFHAHKWMLCNTMVSMASRLKFCDAMIISVVCFAAGHRKIYTNGLRKLDVRCRKLLGRVVGPPGDIDWNQPWHTILHAWHRRIDQQLECHGLKMWSAKYLSEYWKFANYVALLDDNRWGGRPRHSFLEWQTPIQKFCRWHHLGTWLDIARNSDFWFQYYTAFISLVQK